MGKIKANGYATGTSGSLNISLDNYIAPSLNSAYDKILQLRLKKQDEMAKILEQNGVKNFNKKDLLFVVKDRNNELMFLEKGNKGKGLMHILKHKDQIIKKHKLSNDTNIEKYIKNFIETGTMVYEEKNSDSTKGPNRVYKNKDNYLLFTSIGKNGYIITCYPVDKKYIKRRKKKYEKE